MFVQLYKVDANTNMDLYTSLYFLKLIFLGVVVVMMLVVVLWQKLQVFGTY